MIWEGWGGGASKPNRLGAAEEVDLAGDHRRHVDLALGDRPQAEPANSIGS